MDDREDTLYSPVGGKERDFDLDDYQDEHERPHIDANNRRRTLKFDMSRTNEDTDTHREDEEGTTATEYVGVTSKGPYFNKITRRVHQAASRVIPGVNPPPPGVDSTLANGEHPLFVTNTAISSSTLFQIWMYYSAVYSPIYYLTCLCLDRYKKRPDLDSGTIAPVMNQFFLLVFIVVEFLRLPLGWAGNLREKAPQLLFFLFLTLFPQIPILFYFQILQSVLLPVDYGLHLVNSILLYGQFFAGAWALRCILRGQGTKFYLADWKDHATVTDDTLPRGRAPESHNEVEMSEFTNISTN